MQPPSAACVSRRATPISWSLHLDSRPANFGTDGYQSDRLSAYRDLDADLSRIAVIGENKYSHIQPRSIEVVEGDGLDEVWGGLHGYGGRNAWMYWRGGAGGDSFRMIQNAYDEA